MALGTEGRGAQLRLLDLPSTNFHVALSLELHLVSTLRCCWNLPRPSLKHPILPQTLRLFPIPVTAVQSACPTCSQYYCQRLLGLTLLTTSYPVYPA